MEDSRGVGGGAHIFQAVQKILAHKFNIDKKVEPFDTEIIAINSGLRTTIEDASTRFTTNMIVYTDSQSAAGVVNGKSILTCLKEVIEIHETQNKLISRVRLPYIQAGKITAVWI